MSAFERHAVAELVEQALAAGLAVPEEAITFLCGGQASHAAQSFADAHPDEDDESVPPEMFWCCEGSASRGLHACTCWQPVYEQEQAAPVPPTSAADLAVRDRGCTDCAFHADSPERSTPWGEESLFRLADNGTPFWCHDGMRRPLRWKHPAGPVIDGSPHDWQPPMRGGIPYRADGRPGLLCAGWATRALNKEKTGV